MHTLAIITQEAFSFQFSLQFLEVKWDLLIEQIENSQHYDFIADEALDCSVVFEIASLHEKCY